MSLPGAVSKVESPNYLSIKVKKARLQLIKWSDGSKENKFYLMEKIASKWRKFGLFLEIEESQLDGISVEHQNRAEECCQAVLKLWQDNPPSDYPATWGGLIELLDDSKLPEVVAELKNALSKAKYLS